MLSKRGGELGRTIFFIGAGCSVSAGIPTVPQIARRIVIDLCDRFQLKAADDTAFAAYQALVERGRMDACLRQNGDEPRVTALNEADVDWHKVYDHCFERHLRAPNDVRDLFGHLVSESGNAINWAHLCLGELAAKGFVSTVLTTNFDQLVLSGMSFAGLLPVVCDGTESLNRISPNPAHPQLVELHGSRHTYRLRNRPSEVASVAKADPAISAILGLFNHATTFVAVGYGGREDGVMDLLVRAARTYPDKNLYWVLYESDIVALGDKVSMFLRSSDNAFVVPGQDADLFFLGLCRETGVGAPTAISTPLARSAEILRSVRSSKFSDSDIEAEITRAELLVSELAAKQTEFFNKPGPDNLAAQMRSLRLAGRPEEARRLAEGAAEEAIDTQVLREWARALAASGDALADSNVADAAQRYQDGVTICERALSAECNKETELLMSRLLTSLGDALQDAGNIKESHDTFMKAAHFDRRLADKYSEDSQLLRFVAMSLERLSSILVDTGNLSDAKLNIEEALAIRQADFAATPDDEAKLLCLVQCYGALSRIQAEQGDLGAARVAIETAVGKMRHLASDQSLSFAARRELADELGYLSELQRRAGDGNAAKESCKEALLERESLAAEVEGPTQQRDLLMSYGGMGLICVDEGTRVEAEQWFEKAVALARRQMERNPSSATAKEDFVITVSHYVKSLNKVGGAERAVSLAEEALRTAKELVEQDCSPRWLRGLGVRHTYFADALHATGNSEEAKKQLVEALNIFEKLAYLDPSSAEAQRNHSIAIERVAELAAATGDAETALKLFRQSLPIVRDLSGSYPDNQQFARDLMITEGHIRRLEQICEQR